MPEVRSWPRGMFTADRNIQASALQDPERNAQANSGVVAGRPFGDADASPRTTDASIGHDRGHNGEGTGAGPKRSTASGEGSGSARASELIRFQGEGAHCAMARAGTSPPGCVPGGFAGPVYCRKRPGQRFTYAFAEPRAAFDRNVSCFLAGKVWAIRPFQ